MKIINTPEEMQRQALEWRKSGKKIGLVPTMGFLHDGHMSLIDRARPECDILIVSIFVNPTQFGPNEDLDKYPRDFKRDCEQCEAHKVDCIFAPAPEVMYAPDHSTWVVEEKLSRPLCGKSRPIHFRGVATVVTKLFNLTQAEVAVFGRKDAQQALIIKRMVRDLNMPIEIIVAPLVRDTDLVAMSSRNRYLSDSERKSAQVISRSLLSAEDELRRNGIKDIEDIEELISKIKAAITSAGGRIDYVEALDGYNLEPLTGKSSSVLLAVAAYFGTTRLIDNVLVDF